MDRRLGWVTANSQRYEAPSPQSVRAAINQQVCPLCGAGPFVAVAIHVSKYHGISGRDFRLMLGVASDVSICNPDHSAQQRRIAIDGRLILNARLRSSKDVPRPSQRRHSPPSDLPPHVNHGTRLAYRRFKCKCDACRQWQRELVASSKAKRKLIAESRTDIEHGSPNTYTNHGCRCSPCSDAQSRRFAAGRVARAERLTQELTGQA